MIECLRATLNSAFNSVHHVLADKYAANQRRDQLHITMLAGDFWETLVPQLLHSTTGLGSKLAKS